jgi:hypothetical protein
MARPLFSSSYRSYHPELIEVTNYIIDKGLGLCLNPLTEARSPSEMNLKTRLFAGKELSELRTGCQQVLVVQTTQRAAVEPSTVDTSS